MRITAIFKNINIPKIVIYASAVFLTAGTVILLMNLSAEKRSENWQETSLKLSTGTFSGSPLYNILTDSDISYQEAWKISKALQKLMNPKELKENDEYTLFFSSAGNFNYLKINHKLKTYSIVKTRKNGYKAIVRDLPLTATTRTMRGNISGSLWESLIAAEISPQVILQFADLFAWNIDFLTEVRNGDKFALTWEEKKSPGGTVAGSRILAAAYSGAETGRKTGICYKNEYYTETGESMKKLFLRAPLSFRRISSYFTLKRFHPILRYFRPHLGIDYAAPSGTPVSTVADGIIVFAGWKGGFGKYIEVRHSAGYVTSYGHLNRFASGIRSGARVRQGKVIAYVGSTGLSSGP